MISAEDVDHCSKLAVSALTKEAQAIGAVIRFPALTLGCSTVFTPIYLPSTENDPDRPGGHGDGIACAYEIMHPGRSFRLRQEWRLPYSALLPENWPGAMACELAALKKALVSPVGD